MSANKDKPTQRNKLTKAQKTEKPSQETATKSLKSIIAYRGLMQSPFADISDKIPNAPSPPDLADIVRIVSSGLQRLDLTVPQLLALFDALSAESDHEKANEIREAVRTAVQSQWTEFLPGLRDSAIKLFEESKSRWDHGFTRLLNDWPNLRSDPHLRTRAIDVLGTDLALIGERFNSLQALEGDLAAAQRILCLCMTPGASKVNPDKLASLLDAWAGHSIWGQLQHQLWRTGTAGAVPSRNVPAAVTEAVQHIEQLRLTVGGRNPELHLADMAPESRAAWRRLLKKSVGADASLRAAVAEALLWYVAPADDRQAQLAVMELYGHQISKALGQFRKHCARIVRARVESILGLVERQPDTADLIDSRLAAQNDFKPAFDATIRLPKPRTWIEDPITEGMIEAAIASATSSYAQEFESTADSGEETHVANLFREIRHQLQLVSHRIAILAAENESNKRLVLRLDYRVVGKHEEGGRGLDSPRFSTDVCLLVQARNGTSPPFAQRVSLLQAKRLHVREGAFDVEHYPVSLSQLEDLAKQTSSGYLLLIGPNRYNLVMPVLPARLVLDLTDRGQLRSSLYPHQLPSIARNLASWLTYDAIGLWTGDWRPALLRRAKGAKRRQPFLLVEITAETQTVEPDGWAR